MHSLEQKKTHVAMLLKEKDFLKRAKLEQAITGQVRFKDYIGPVAITVFCFGIATILSIGKIIDPSVLSLVVLLILVDSVWSNFQMVATNRQITALKEYIDIKVEEIGDENKS